MHPQEFYWQAEAREQARAMASGKLTEEEALEMKEELRIARVKAGYPPE